MGIGASTPHGKGCDMRISTDVRLSAFRDAVFPERCVACGREQPRDSVRICTWAVGWWSLATMAPGARFCVNAPACLECRNRLQRRRGLRPLAAFGALGSALVFGLLDGFKGQVWAWLTFAIAVGCMLPWFLTELLYPPPLDLAAHATSVDYRFQDEGYAKEFARLNDDEFGRADGCGPA
jgi:hypothetical protein